MNAGEGAPARVLLVDDDPGLLSALVRNLRKWPYDITTAVCGAEALRLLEHSEPFAVIVSDLRMPEMDGVTLLAQAGKIAPDTVRILFTGTPDLENAAAAINKSSIFRFMTKPCPTPLMALTLNAAVEQNRLITSERVLLEQTLRGSIKALLDILAAASPMAFGRAGRLRELMTSLTARLGIQARWQMEIAAMLSQIGHVILPPATLERIYQCEELSEAEHAMLERMPGVVSQILGNIPRLEPILEILRYQEKSFDGSGRPADDVAGETIPWGARALKLILDLDMLERSGLPTDLAFDTVRGRTGRYDAVILEALAEIRHNTPRFQVCELPVAALRTGMVLAQAIRSEAGILIVARGQELTPGLLEKLHNFLRPEATIRVIVAEV